MQSLYPDNDTIHKPSFCSENVTLLRLNKGVTYLNIDNKKFVNKTVRDNTKFVDDTYNYCSSIIENYEIFKNYIHIQIEFPILKHLELFIIKLTVEGVNLLGSMMLPQGEQCIISFDTNIILKVVHNIYDDFQSVFLTSISKYIDNDIRIFLDISRMSQSTKFDRSILKSINAKLLSVLKPNLHNIICKFVDDDNKFTLKQISRYLSRHKKIDYGNFNKEYEKTLIIGIFETWENLGCYSTENTKFMSTYLNIHNKLVSRTGAKFYHITLDKFVDKRIWSKLINCNTDIGICDEDSQSKSFPHICSQIQEIYLIGEYNKYRILWEKILLHKDPITIISSYELQYTDEININLIIENGIVRAKFIPHVNQSSFFSEFIIKNLHFPIISDGFISPKLFMYIYVEGEQIDTLNDYIIKLSQPKKKKATIIVNNKKLIVELKRQILSNSEQIKTLQSANEGYLAQIESLKIKRPNIPKSVRDSVWRKCIGNLDGHCWACNCSISFDKWHCGHIQPYSKSGEDKIDNLRPLCQACNLSMSNRDMKSYILQYYSSGPGYEEFSKI